MMEGEAVEWTIDEQSCLQEEDDRDISKTRWILERGLRLGRKIVITGIVVSSAPLVLPPLITISVLGFVVLVPVGFFFASYACTEKLMSKLLPMPAPPLLLEYRAEVFRDGEKFEALEEDLYGRDYESEFSIQEEKKEEMKMEGEGAEKRIELVMEYVAVEEGGSQCVEKHDDKKEIELIMDYEAVDNEEGSQYVKKHDDKKEIDVDDLEGELEDEKKTNVDENLEEEVYEEEDIIEYLQGEREDEKDVNTDENMEKGYEEDGGECFEGEHKHTKEIIVDEDVVEFLEAECEDKKDISIDENLEKGYEEDAGEYLEGEDEDSKEINNDGILEEEGYEEAIGGEYLGGEHKDEKDNIEENLEKGYEEDAGEYLDGEDEDEKEINIDENLEEGYGEAIGEYLEEEHQDEKDNIDENLEKGYEEDAGEYDEGEHEDRKDINIDENLDEGYEEAVGDYLEGDHEDEKDNMDENLEKGYEEDAGEYAEGEHEDKKDINIDENLDEGYEEAVGDYLEGEHEDEKDNIDENLEKGYEGAVGEYLEGEHEDKKDNIEENLEKGYEEDTGEYLEGEHEDKKEINIDEDLKEEGYDEDVGEYLEGEHEGPMPEMNMEVERGRQELHCEFGENVKRTEGLDLVARSARGENYNDDKVGNDEAEENFEYKSVPLLGNVGNSMKEDEQHLEKFSGFEEEAKKEARSAKGDENTFNVTDAKVEITVAEVKATEHAPETEKQGNGGKGNAAEQVSPGAPSSEVMLSEEKIWEQISAIRGILGYTAAPQSSTVDELKALFILTGVEPPSPFEDPSDLEHVNDKLRILMSIVGTK